MSDEQRYVWEPVGEPIGPVELEIEYYTHGDSDAATHYDAGHLGDGWVSLGGDVVTTISWGAHDDYRLCRRVPATGVPVEVRDALILAEDALAELIGADYDVDGSLAAVRAALALI